MSPAQRLTVVSVGETIDLVADVANASAGDPVAFEVAVAGEARSLARIDGHVHEDADAPGGLLARGTWVVDVGNRDPSRDLPLDAEFTASLAGGAPVKAGTLRIQAPGSLAPPQWLLDPVGGTTPTSDDGDPAAANLPPEPLADATVEPGEKLILRVEIGDSQDPPQPLIGDFAIRFRFHEVLSDGTLAQPSAHDVSHSIVASAPGVHAVKLHWTARVFSGSVPKTYRVAVEWDRRPFEKSAPKSLATVLSPPITVTGRVIVQLAEPSFVRAQASETVQRPDGKVPWAETQVEVDFPGVAAPSAAAVDDHGHAVIPVGAPQGASGTARVLRDDGLIWRVTAANATVQAGAVNRLELSSRLRISVWAAAKNVGDAENLAGAKGVVDDLALLKTIRNASDKPFRLIWDPNEFTLPGGTTAEAFLAPKYGAIIEDCHRQGIQVFAGYGLVTEVNAAAEFNQWLRNANRVPTFDQYVDQIANFLLTLSLTSTTPQPPVRQFDGLSFDCEAVGGDLRAPVVEFFGILGRRLHAQGMAVINAPGPIVAQDGTDENSAVLIAVDDRDKPGSHVRLIGSGQAQPYTIARAPERNVIVRPQCYDVKPVPPDLSAWHEHVVDYALSTVKLHPGTFQIGIKTEGPASPGKPAAPGHVDPGTAIEQRCAGFLRPNRVGLSIFALHPNQDWSTFHGYNDQLNPGEAPAGTLGQPLQWPIGLLQALRLGIPTS